MKWYILLLVMLHMGSFSCAWRPQPKSPVREAVLQPSERIFFRNANGQGTISYITEKSRHFDIPGYIDKTIEMTVRPERFLGELGIYSAGERWFFEPAVDPRVVYRESELHFKSLEEAKTQLIEGSAVSKWVYNENGYVVGFDWEPERDQVGVILYRYFINGEPARIPGYDNSAVRLIRN